jgi:hypothetical protein
MANQPRVQVNFRITQEVLRSRLYYAENHQHVRLTIPVAGEHRLLVFQAIVGAVCSFESSDINGH